MTNTAKELLILHALSASMAGGAVSISATDAAKLLKIGVIGLIKRDMQKAAGDEVSFMDFGSVLDETMQTDWRDNTGYVCSDERTANFVAKWCAKYLDPKDADGNKWTPLIQKITKGRFFVVVNSYKISP